METAIVILAFLALYHFIVDSILVPTERLKLRCKIFKLRDSLRKLKDEKGSEISDSAYLYVQHSLNAGINILPNINFWLIYDVNNRIEHDAHLQRAVEGRIEAIRNSTELIKISSKLNNYMFTAMLVNTMAWSIYVLPISLVLIPCLLLYRWGKKVKETVSELLVMPSNQFDNIVSPYQMQVS